MVSSGPIAGGLHKVPRAIGESATQTDKNPPTHTHTQMLWLFLDQALAWSPVSFHTQLLCGGFIFKTFARETSVKGGANNNKTKKHLFLCLNVTFLPSRTLSKLFKCERKYIFGENNVFVMV